MEPLYKDHLQCAGVGEAHIALSTSRSLSAALRRHTSLGSLPRVAYEPRNDGQPITRFGRQGPHEVGRRPNGVGAKYALTLSEMIIQNLFVMTMADPNYDWGSEAANNAQSAISASAGQAFDFDESDSGLGVEAGQMTELFDSSGNKVYFPTAVTLAGVNLAYGAAGDGTALAEGVDFELDTATGKILWLKAINDDVITPTITAPAITSASSNYMRRAKMMSQQQIHCFLDIYIHNKGGPVVFHSDRGAWGSLYVTGGYEVGENGEMRPTAEFTVHQAGIVEQRVNEGA